VTQSIDSASRTIGGVNSRANSADLTISTELKARLRAHLSRRKGKSELLSVNRCGRPLCADKLREKQLHPLLEKLGIEKGGFHSMRHGAASALLADGASAALMQRQLRHSDPRITLGAYARSRRSATHGGAKSQCAAGELGPIVKKGRSVRKKINSSESIRLAGAEGFED